MKNRRRFSAQAASQRRVILRGHADRLAARQFARQRIALRRSRSRTDAIAGSDLVVTEMNSRCDDRRRHGHETHGAADGAYIERGPTHQWNICTVCRADSPRRS